MELVSVVVPIYNVEKYLEKCVESLRAQTYKNIEIILVDDGSPDHCGKMCDEYAGEDTRIKVIHKKNGGLSDARNAGLEAASGKYILFTDSDDYVKKDLIEKCVDWAEKDQCDIVIFDFIRVEEGLKEITTLEIEDSGTYSLRGEPRLLFGSPSAVNKLFRRDLFVKTEIRFPVGKYYEDLGTTPKLLLMAERIGYLKEAFYYYMIRSGSIMTGAKVDKNYQDRTAMINQVLDFFKEHGAYETYYQELEYLAVMNGYFLPSREIILQDRKSPVLKKFKSYIYTIFPDFHSNKYLKQYLSKKDRLHLKTIETEQYWFMVMLSKGRILFQRLFRSRKG